MGTYVPACVRVCMHAYVGKKLGKEVAIIYSTFGSSLSRMCRAQAYSACIWVCASWFLSTGHKLETPEKKKPPLRNCLHQIVCIKSMDFFLIND